MAPACWTNERKFKRNDKTKTQKQREQSCSLLHTHTHTKQMCTTVLLPLLYYYTTTDYHIQKHTLHVPSPEHIHTFAHTSTHVPIQQRTVRCPVPAPPVPLCLRHFWFYSSSADVFSIYTTHVDVLIFFGFDFWSFLENDLTKSVLKKQKKWRTFNVGNALQFQFAFANRCFRIEVSKEKEVCKY